MKRIYCTFLLSVMLSLVTNAQEVTMDFLKSSTWTWNRISYQVAFTEDSMYMGTKLVSFGVSPEAYYLSSEPHSRFRDELVGKNKKGSYVVVKSNESTPSQTYSFKITSASEKGLTLYCKEVPEYAEMILTKNDCEKYDTLQLSCAYKELAYKHGKQYQQAFFDAFPSIWYDFERTFNGAFFKKEVESIYKQDFSHEFEKYLNAFSNLKDIDTKEYYRKLIDVTIGMPIQSTPASDKWQKIVTAKVARNKRLVSQLLKEKSELQQARFWQFMQQDNRFMQKNVVGNKKQRFIKEIYGRGYGFFDVELVCMTDSLCYYITNCVPKQTPGIEFVVPCRMTEDSCKTDKGIVLTRIHSDKGTILQMYIPEAEKPLRKFGEREPSAVTDTLLMAVAYRNLVSKNMDQREMQHLFFEGFPSTWSEFYAVMISDEYGNNGFRSNAGRYINAFKLLSYIPVHEKLRKMVGISIGAIAQDPTSELWRTVVSDLSTQHKEELNSVLQEFEPWQQTSFRQFVENKE